MERLSEEAGPLRRGGAFPFLDRKEPSAEGGKDYIWGTPPDPCQKERLSEEAGPLRRGGPSRMGTPSGLPFFSTLLV